MANKYAVTPSVATALATLNQAKSAQAAGDAMGYELAIKQLQLQAREHQLATDRRHAKEIETLNSKLFDTESKLQQKIAENAIRAEMRKALQAGDMKKFDALSAMLAKKQRPDDIQKADYFRSNTYEDTEDRADTRDILGGGDQTAMEQLRIAKEKGLLDDDELKRGAQNIANDPMSNNAKDAEFVQSLVERGILTQEEADDLIKDIFDDDPRGTGGSTTDAGALQRILDAYPAFGANRKALDRIVGLMNKDKGQKIGHSLHAMLQGRPLETIEQEEKDSIADYMAYIALAEPPGGDITKRFNFAQNILKDSIPTLVSSYTAVRGKLGRMTQVEEGVYRFTGKTADPEVARFQAILERLVNDYVVLRSGATVTDTEFQRYLATLPGIGKEAEVNDQMMYAMYDSLNTYFSSYFNRSLGEEWGAEATRVVMGDALNAMGGAGIQRQNGGGGTQPTTPTTPSPQPQGQRKLSVSDLNSILQQIASGRVTAEQMRESLRRRGYDTTELDRALLDEGRR